MNKDILLKLQEARQVIKRSSLKKAGRNEFGKYDYYTPDQVELLVQQATEATNTIALCNLKEDKFGLYQELIFVEIQNPENCLSFQLRTKLGAVTATNETQQMGSTDTYSERYIKMKVFGIKDNTLDPESQDQRRPKDKPATDQQIKQIKDGVQYLPEIEQGKVNGWLKKDHSFKDAEKTFDRMNAIIDENA